MSEADAGAGEVMVDAGWTFLRGRGEEVVDVGSLGDLTNGD
jgi:hypothetical protein